MEYKLKHLSKYCCKPANKLEFEAVKMAAEIGGVELGEFEWPNLDVDRYDCAWVDDESGTLSWARKDDETELSILDFCNKLRMTEEEAEKLEDDRVVFFDPSEIKNCKFSQDYKTLTAFNGHYFKTNEDGTEVTLYKRESCARAVHNQ